jgi:hypothetical protein
VPCSRSLVAIADLVPVDCDSPWILSIIVFGMVSFLYIAILASMVQQSLGVRITRGRSQQTCPENSRFNRWGQQKCRCTNWKDVCINEDGRLGCQGSDDYSRSFSPDCVGCSCVSPASICKGGGIPYTDYAGGYSCYCGYRNVCVRNGVFGACAPPPTEFPPANTTYPTSCEDCKCVPEADICPPEAPFHSSGRCKCGLEKVCTRDGLHINCGLQYEKDEFWPACKDCQCVSKSSLPEPACASESGALGTSPNSYGDCQCGYDSFCSTDGGLTANCPSFWEYDNERFHYWCENCKCYPTKQPCPAFAEQVDSGNGWCRCNPGFEKCQTKSGADCSWSASSSNYGVYFDSSCEDCMCVKK